MKHLLRSLLCSLAALVLAFSFAHAAPRYPAYQGSVTDAAAVLTAETTDQLKAVIRDVSDETNIVLYIVTVDFLDGYTIDSYAHGLQEYWQNLSNSLLVLLAVGEDRCTVVSYGDGGDILIPQSTLQKLANTYITPAMLREDYNGAMHDFIPALLTELNKAYDVSLPVDYFSAAPAKQESVLPANWLENWTFGISGAEKQYDDYRADHDDDDDISIGKIILTVILLSALFRDRRRHRRMGCGCSPLSRILAFFGLWRLWDRD